MLEQAMKKAERGREENCACIGIERIARSAPQDHVLIKRKDNNSSDRPGPLQRFCSPRPELGGLLTSSGNWSFVPPSRYAAPSITSTLIRERAEIAAPVFALQHHCGSLVSQWNTTEKEAEPFANPIVSYHAILIASEHNVRDPMTARFSSTNDQQCCDLRKMRDTNVCTTQVAIHTFLTTMDAY